MQRLLFLPILFFQVLILNGQNPIHTGSTADSIVSKLTLDEKITLLGGHRIFYTHGVERFGIKPVLFSDATQGIALRPAPIYKGWKKPLKRTLAYPAPILLASTWDTELVYRYAEAIGEECRSAGIGVLLGPGFNMYRISQCGRNFEYFGEDPYLVSKLIGSYVSGVQSTGTIATLKHFVANNSDFYRRKSNSIVDERTLNEIYLPAFKAGIDAGAGAVMTSYNLLNGEWCGQSDYVINGLLREHLGFNGLVMTDWWSVNDGIKLAGSGQDLEMPSRKALKKVKREVSEGSVKESEIDRMVASQISTFLDWKTYELEPSVMPVAMIQRHESIAYETAQKGIVLLKNREHLLPIDTLLPLEILVTGPYADRKAYGTGAARVKGYNHQTIREVMQKSSALDLNFDPDPDEAAIKRAGMVIVCAGTIDGEGRDRAFALPMEQEQLILRCVNQNPNTVVIINSGSGVRMTDWNEQAGAILYGWYFGQNGALAMLDILTGRINPSGRLPITIEREFEDSPGHDYLPAGESLYEGYNGYREKRREVYDITYDEGIFTGYRWYDNQEIEPLYPFGHGLSYTDFVYRELEIQEPPQGRSDTIRVKFLLKNGGEIAGEEVVQIYISHMNSSIQRPEQELKGFKKILLDGGEERPVELEIPVKELAYWSVDEHHWMVEPGDYEIRVGSSSRDARLYGKCTLE